MVKYLAVLGIRVQYSLTLVGFAIVLRRFHSQYQADLHSLPDKKRLGLAGFFSNPEPEKM
jgi:hypothetical protein